ncbi:recombinase family protein [Rhodococcus artemisiae]|uniref:Uncharacterized protein n=1 Tax=Rhodococcus artemisiae TaxID=714159 RepID=A0ABU7LN21_9NOCA|nr:hypothetical protein [Rhodococcus artemisiae]MEE2062352.1 hypothetical protein [Rhodococcus artemisiae]
MIIVECRDRRTRLGAERPIAALFAQGRRIVAGDHGRNHDPMRNMIEVLTPMCARLHDHSRARCRAMRTTTTTTTARPEVV